MATSEEQKTSQQDLDLIILRSKLNVNILEALNAEDSTKFKSCFNKKCTDLKIDPKQALMQLLKLLKYVRIRDRGYLAKTITPTILTYLNDHPDFIESITLQELSLFDLPTNNENSLNLIKNRLKNIIYTKNSDEVWETFRQKLLQLTDPQNDKTIFKNVSKLKLILTLAATVEHPYTIEQPNETNLCGPAAILTCIFTEDPQKIISAIFLFFETGYVSGPLKLLASSVSKKNEQNVIVAVMSAMKHASNYLGYTSPTCFLETYRGMTEPNKMMLWLKSLGYTDLYEDIKIITPLTSSIEFPKFARALLRTTYSSYHKLNKKPEDRENLLTLLITNKKKAIMLISMDLWTKISSTQENTEEDKEMMEIFNYMIRKESSSNRFFDIGHYVYLYSLKETSSVNKLEYVFYADGQLIKGIIDKFDFLKGLKGIITMEKEPKNSLTLPQHSPKLKAS